MSSQYPVLNNRPIDQWKVTELKEELKKRKLITRGLKDDLIRRLDEALRLESEDAQEANGLGTDPQPEDEPKGAEKVVIETKEAVVHNDGNRSEKLVDVVVQVETNVNATTLQRDNVEAGVILGISDYASVKQDVVVENTSEVSETVAPEVDLTEDKLHKTELEKDNENSKLLLEKEGLDSQLENRDSKPQLEKDDLKYGMETDNSEPQLEEGDLKPQVEIEDPRPQVENEESKTRVENEDEKPLHKDVMLDSSAPSNQVSEVSPSLGSQVRTDSISSDTVSINEKIELKDNISADHVKLELDDVVKLEMVEPSSNNAVGGGQSHPMDVEEPLENKDENPDTLAHIDKKIDRMDMGYSEKLNLDRSSGDDSMEEDVLESKQIDSKYHADEIGDKIKKNEEPIVNEEHSAGVVGESLISNKNDTRLEQKNHSTLPAAEKRKLNDQATAGNESIKRQRRWASENVKVPEPESKSFNAIPSTTPKEIFQPKPSFSRSNSAVNEDAPKERIVPPPKNPPTDSLRIDCFVRPFTLKAIQELLGRTGNVTSFWMDHIKTHCYVTYSSVEEAVETRNAVYNLQWPTNGGRHLMAEFVDAQEVRNRVEAPAQTQAASVTTAPPALPALVPQPSPHVPARQQPQKLPPPPPLPLPPPPPLSDIPQAIERLPFPPPALEEKMEPPIVTLDDLFRKTKATPRIYYLPLSEEEVAAKLAVQGGDSRI